MNKTILFARIMALLAIVYFISGCAILAGAAASAPTNQQPTHLGQLWCGDPGNGMVSCVTL